MYLLKKVDLKSVNILKKLMIDTFKQAYESMHTKENIKAYCDKSFTKQNVEFFLMLNVFTVFIAFKEDLPVGFFILKDEECPLGLNGTSLELHQLYILKSEYSKGLGKKLFNHVVKISKEKTKKYIWLYASNTNDRALFFYGNIGFDKIGIGKELQVGTDSFSSSTMIYKI